MSKQSCKRIRITIWQCMLRGYSCLSIATVWLGRRYLASLSVGHRTRLRGRCRDSQSTAPVEKTGSRGEGKVGVTGDCEAARRAPNGAPQLERRPMRYERHSERATQ